MSPRIPAIVHQSWKDEAIPYDVYDRSWVESWTRMNPGWQWRYWTDADNEALVRECYPEFLGFYQALHPNIKKADFARFLYMHRFGGVYADLDFVCLRSLEPLLGDYDIVLGRLSEDNDYYQIPNAFMASRPGLDFWLDTARDAVNAPPEESATETLSGPFRLQWSYEMRKPENSAVFGNGVIYPFDWIHFTGWDNGRYYREDLKRLASDLRNRTPEEMAEVFPHSYCLTFWTHNW